MLSESPRALHPLPVRFIFRTNLIKAAVGLTIQFGQFGLRIESVDVRDAPGIKQKMTFFTFGGK